MSYPSLTCAQDLVWFSFQGPASQPADQEFNQVKIFHNTTGDLFSVWNCSPDTSTFLPLAKGQYTLTEAEYLEIFPLLTLILVTGYIFKRLIGALL